MLSSPTRKWSALLSTLALVLALALTLLPAAQAKIHRPFETVYSAQIHGDIVVTGNGNLACPSTDAKCLAAQAGTGSGQNETSNNGYYMEYIDADNDASTFNSTMTTLAVPDGAEIEFARLYWGGTTKKKSNGAGVNTAATDAELATMKFGTPDGTYHDITATDPLDRNTYSSKDYSARADVTELVKAHGGGEYWGANIHSSRGVDRYSGWALVVVYKKADEQLRDLRVFDGYAQLGSTTSLSQNISGFITPADGPVTARVGAVVWEGDVGFKSDYMLFNGVRLQDELSPSDNFFNSTVSTQGALQDARNPDYRHTMQLDAKTVSVPAGTLTNGQQSATVTFGTNGDWYLPNVLTTSIDIEEAELVPVKSVTNLSGNDPAEVGDILEYRIDVTNIGKDTAIRSMLKDPIPTGTTLVPGSIKVINGSEETSLTEASGDDAADYSNRVVTVRLGDGASATAGGEMPEGAMRTVVFQVEVGKDAANQVITNHAATTFQGKTLKQNRTSTSNSVDTEVAKLVDVAIAKSGPAKANAGEQVTWDLTVTNAGPSDADDVVVTDTLPEGATFVSATPECTAEGQVLTCAVGALAANGTHTIAVTATLASDLEPSTLTNGAEVTSSNTDSNPDNNSSSATTEVENLADMSLLKSVAPTAIRPGESATWTLDITNEGPSLAKNVSVSDVIPDGLTVTAVDAPCADEQGTVSCQWDSFAAGETKSVTVTTRLAADATASVVNTATVASDTADPDPDNDTDSATLQVLPPLADVTINKVLVSESVSAGLPVTYNLVVGNNGPSVASGIAVSDTLPDELSNARVNGGGATCSVAGNLVSCDIATLAVGAKMTITVTADVDEAAVGQIANTASATPDTEDPDLTNNSSTVTTEVKRSADLAIAKTTSPAVAGEDVVYTLTVNNNGPATATGVVITDDLPADLEYVSATSDSGTCTPEGAVLTCSMADLAVGASYTATVTMHVPEDMADASTVTNTARVSSEVPDPDMSNNEASASITSATDADLAITKTGPESIDAGEEITWTLVATNNGPSDAVNASLTDSIPDGVTGVSATSTAGSCTAGANVECHLGTVADGASVTVTVTGTVSPDFTGTQLTNNASVTSDTSDPTTSNNSASSSTTVQREADLGVAKTGPTSLTAGEAISWTMTVTNHGPSTAVASELSDALPEGIINASATSSVGDCTITDRVVDCQFGTLAVDGTATVTVDGMVAPSFIGEKIVNTATVGSLTPDPNTDNDSASATTDITRSADLAIAKAGPASAKAGEEISWTMTVTNNGPSTALSSSVSDTLPAEILNPSASTTAGLCTVTDSLLDCQLGEVGVNPVTITVTGQIDPAFAGDQIANTADVTSKTPDSDLTNNSSSATTEVTRAADLVMEKNGTLGTVAGEAISWTLTVRNDGPSTAAAPAVADTLPEGVADGATVTTDAGTCDPVSGRDIACTLEDLAPGATATINVEGSVLPGFTGEELINTASVSSTTPDPNEDNNSSDFTTSITHLADISVVKTGPVKATAGEAISWTITVHNDGPSTAGDTLLFDELPAGVEREAEVTPSAGMCTVWEGVIICELGDIEVGDTVTVTINGTAESGFAGDEILNSAEAESVAPDPNLENNGDDASSALDRNADLVLTKAGSVETVAGGAISWTINVSNEGPSDATRTIVTDPLPEGVTDAEVTSSAGVCSVTAEEIFCDLDTITPRDPAVIITVNASVSPSFAGEAIENTASVTSSTPDANTDNNSDDATTTVSRSADLAIVKVGDEEATAGEAISWTLTVTNNGPSDAQGVVVSDELPEGVADNATVTSEGATCTLENRIITCEVATLAAGGEFTINIAGTANADFAGDEILNTATVTSSTPDPNEENNGGSSTTGVNRKADLSIVKTGTEKASAGEAISWTLEVANEGPSVATEVVVTDTLPEGVADDATATASPGTCTVASRVITCDLGTLAVNGTAEISILGDILPDFAGDEIVNTAAVSSATPDPSEENNSSSSTTEVTRSADLAIVKVGDEKATAGEAISWTLTATNNGPSDAQAVVISDELPEGVSDDVTVSSEGATCTVENRIVTCALDTLASGATAVINIDGTADADFAGDQILNTATVTSSTPDPNEENNGGSSTTELDRKADLSIVKTGTEKANAGEEISWNLEIVNEGPSVARTVVVTDSLPEGVADDATVETTLGACDLTARELSCQLGTLAVSGTATITITGDILPGYAGDEIVNTAAVSSVTPDPSEENNSSSSTTEVTRSADVALEKTGATSAVAGEAISWTLEVTNNGPSDAADVAVTDELPAGVGDDVTVTTDAGECTVADRVLDCQLGILGAGDSTNITLAGQVLPGFTGDEIVNTASVSSVTPDPDEENNTSSTTTEIERYADLAIVKTGTEAASAGEAISWSLEVTNNGPSDAADVAVTDELPAGVGDDVTVTTDAGECTVTDRVINCQLGVLGTGTSVAITIDGVTDAAFAGDDILNTASVTSMTEDPDTTNNGSSFTTVVGRLADLSIVKTGSPANAGEPISWILSVRNGGPSVATDVVVSDELPEGMADDAVATTTRGACHVSDRILTCDLGVLAVGDEVEISLDGQVLASYAEKAMTNTASVTSTTPDDDPSDNTSSATSIIGAVAELSIVKTGPAKAQAGEKISWTLEIANGGTADARDVVITDTLPDSVTPLKAEAPEGIDCDTVKPGVVCTASVLPAGQSVSIVITGKLADDVTGKITNVADVTSSTTEDPATTGNNADDATTNVTPKPPVPFGPDMPHTGASVAKLMAFTTMLLALGIVLIAVRRRSDA